MSQAKSYYWASVASHSCAATILFNFYPPQLKFLFWLNNFPRQRGTMSTLFFN